MSGQASDDGIQDSKNAKEPSAADGGANSAVNDLSPDDFARQAEEAPMGLIAEFWDFLKHEKKWWLTPIIVVLLALGVIIFVGGSVAAPFIYPIF